MGGFVRYGIVKNDFILIKGSVSAISLARCRRRLASLASLAFAVVAEPAVAPF